MKKTLSIFLALLLVSSTFLSLYKASVLGYAITVDGDPSDWLADTSAQAVNTGMCYATGEYVWKDAAGDDVGDGDYTYPTNSFFVSGMVDILEFRVTYDAHRIYFLIKLGDVTNAWGAGEGFCGILVTIHIDEDRVPYSGQEWTAQGMDAKLDPSCWWEYVIVLHGFGSWIMDSSWATVGWTGNGMEVKGSESNDCIEVAVDYDKIGSFISETWRFTVQVGFEEWASFREVQENAAEWSPGGGVPSGDNDWVECDAFDACFYASKTTQTQDWGDYDQGAGNPTILCNTGEGFMDISHASIIRTAYVVLGGTIAPLAKGMGTNEKFYWGSGCWAAVLNQKFEIYIDPTLPPFNTLGTFTIDDIAGISYYTNTPHAITGTTPYNFYLVIYTKPDGFDDKASWYGYKLIAEPYFSNNLNAPANQWNKWSTDADTNQLTFFDPDTIGFYGFYGQPTLQDIQAGPINWHDYYPGCPETNIDYGAEIVKYISLQTATAWMNIFQGFIDAITITLKDGTTVSVDLEGFASEVWVDDDWVSLPPGYEVEPGKFIGYNAFAKIQDAISAVTLNGVIHVYSGTYNEALYISKPLTIKGESIPIIKGSGAFTTNYMGAPWTREAVIFVVNSTDVVLQSLDIEGENLGPGYNDGVVYVYSSGEIRNCIVSPNTIGNMYSLAVEARASDLKVIETTIKNFGRIGVYFANCTGGVYGSTIIGQVYSDADKVNYGIEVEPHQGVRGTIEIIGNEICNSDNTYSPEPKWSSAGILIDGWKEYMATPSSTVVIQCNNIHDNYHGIEAAANILSYARYNNIYNNRIYGVISAPDYQGNNETFDARYNWWGDMTGPYHPILNPTGLGDEVSDNVNFEPWLLTEKVPPLVHDIAVLNVVPSAVRVASGTTIHVDVTVKNEGNTYETFDVSLYYDSHLIDTQTITDMVPGSTEHLTFSWDTSGVPYGTYTLKAEATVVPGETDTEDNVFIDGIVRIGPEALIKVEPPLYQAQLLNKTFQVNVTIHDLWEGWRAVAVQFRLCYNETLLEFVDVTQGPFMQDPRWNKHGTFFIWFNELNDPIYGSHVIVGILLLPDPDTGVWEAFPSGSGVLATITFKTIYQERGLEKPPLTCELALVDTMVIDDDLEEIPLILENGLYEMYPTHIGDINYDGKVDMKDVAMVSKAFGSYPGYGPWNPICDVNGDGKVDIKDVAIVSKGFGWTKTYDP